MNALLGNMSFWWLEGFRVQGMTIKDPDPTGAAHTET